MGQRHCQGTFFWGGNFTPIFKAKKLRKVEEKLRKVEEKFTFFGCFKGFWRPN